MDGNKPKPDPFMKLPTPDQVKRQAWLKEKISEGQKKIEAPVAKLDGQQAAW